jgi:hypothetical protein
MLLMGVAEGVEGDTEIAAPLLRVAVRASMALGFADASPVRAGNAATAVAPPSVAHRLGPEIGNVGDPRRVGRGR